LIPRQTITVTRRLKGSYVNGVYVSGATSTSTIRASVQPTTSDDLLSLPEGRRSSGSFRLYTNDQISEQTATHDPDIVTLFGEKYEIVKVFKWDNGVIPHLKALALKLENPA
jgi:hypothetical protein